MLTVTDITAFLRQNIAYTFVTNEFAPSNHDDCAYVRMSGGFRPSEWTSKKRPSFQIVLRSKSAKTADDKAYEIFAHLNSLTEERVGSTRVVKCVADQSSPLYLGKDENGRALYSLNFTATTL